MEQFRDRGYTQSSLLNFVSSYGAGFSQLTFPVSTPNHNLLLDELTKRFTPEKVEYPVQMLFIYLKVGVNPRQGCHGFMTPPEIFSVIAGSISIVYQVNGLLQAILHKHCNTISLAVR